jgi:GPH family glycoside/pentoside/hexuronide:cation symporter
MGVGIALSILGMAGYQPKVAQPESVVFTLRLLYSLVPSLCNLAALSIAFFYPITTGLHSDIRAAIEQRKKGESITDPLR